MAIKEMSFYVAPAYIAKVVSAKVVEFWCRDEDVDYDATPPTRVDLSKVPTEELTTWDVNTVEIDSKYTNIPRDFGEVRKYEGRIYCNPQLFASLSDKGWTPADSYRYQCLVQQVEGDPIRRFHGFKATVIKTPAVVGTNLVKLKVEPVQGSARELWIELDDLDTCLPTGTYTTISSSYKIGDDGAIFLDSDFIEAHGLAVPKLPESMGLEGFAPGGSFTPGTDPVPQSTDPGDGEAPPESLLVWPSLNIVSVGSDKELEEITSLVQMESLAQDAGQVAVAIEDYLNGSLTKGKTPKYLDLVGHSISPECYLTIGNWTIKLDDLEAIVSNNLLKTKITRLNPQGVRLLGCATATTKAGFAVMQQLSKVLNVKEVFGTTQLIDSSDFGPTGFKSEGLLHASSADSPASFNFMANSLPEKRVAVSFSPSKLRAAPVQSRRAPPYPQRIVSSRLATEFVKKIDPDVAWAFHGLLARPSVELLIPRDGGDRYELQVLVDHQIVRVFPSGGYDQGLVYRVTDPDALRRLVREAPPPRSE